MILSLLLLAADPSSFGTSELVDPTHEHDWVLLDDESVGLMWWDRNSIETRDFDGVELPTVLTRLDASGEDVGFARADMALAVDCDANKIAWTEIHVIGAGEAGDHRVSMPELSWEPLPSPNSEQTYVMMTTVCGEDWTA